MPKKIATKKRAAKKKSVKRTPATKLPVKPGGTQFADVFAGLKGVMSAFADEFKIASDEPKKYYLVTKSKSWKGGPLSFGAVMMGKAYVSYHLLPLYMYPELTKAVSAELKKRMQGKACFNFRACDEAMFAQLGEVTKAGLEKYREKKLL